MAIELVRVSPKHFSNYVENSPPYIDNDFFQSADY